MTRKGAASRSKTDQLNVRLRRELMDVVAAVVFLEGYRSAAELIRTIAEDYLDRRRGEPRIQKALQLRAEHQGILEGEVAELPRPSAASDQRSEKVREPHKSPGEPPAASE